MKKQLITTLICAGFALPAAAQPVIYGKANVSYQTADEGNESFTEVKSNASRLGVKGKLGVENDIEAIYQAEFEANFDDGDKGGQTFTQRNIYVGLKGGFGTVKAGKFDSPLKKAQNKVDLFNDLEGDIKNLITVNDNRPSNIISYQTPALGAFLGTVALVSSEEDGVDDGVSASVTYEQNGIYVSAAFDQNVEDDNVDVVRLVGQYNVAGFQFGVLHETVDAGGVDDVDGIFGSVMYKLDRFAFKVQFGQSDIDELDGESLSLGVDYKLAKQLKLFSYYTQLESDEGTDNDYLGGGVELKF